MIQDEFKNLAKSDFGKVLMNFLDEEIKEMTDITKIKDYDELLGKQEAVKILRKLFSFLKKTRDEKPIIKRTDYN